jgi:hypothetical protein
MGTDGKKDSTGIKTIRWFARGFGMLISVFFLFMFIGEALESNLRHPTTPVFSDINPVAAIGLGLMGIYIIAMLLALKWEHAGTLLSVGALGAFFVIMFLGLFPGNVSGGLSFRGVLNPILLFFWLPVLLYLLCWRLEVKQTRQPDVQPRRFSDGKSN